METVISATELAKGLSDVLNRVKYRGETFVIERNGEAIARLTSPGPGKDFSMRDLIRLLASLPRPDEDFADDLEAIHATQTRAEMPDWPS